MIEVREITIGIAAGLVLAFTILGFIYLPGYFRNENLPDKENVKFISINDLSFRDWALRLNQDNLSLPHYGYFRSHVISAPINLKDIHIADEGETNRPIRRIYGQFESINDSAEFYGKFEATIQRLEPTNIKIDLFSGKINDERVSSNRITGEINIVEDIKSNKIQANMQIGSVNYGGIPFGATNLRFEGNLEAIKSEITTQLSGHQGTSAEFHVVFNRTVMQNITGLINITSYKDLLSILGTVASGTTKLPPDFLPEIKDLNIEIRQNANDPNVNRNIQKFDLLTDKFGHGFKSIVILDKVQKKLQIAARFKEFLNIQFPFGLERTGGDISYQGAIELSFNQQDDEIYGPFKAKLEHVQLKKGDFLIDNLNTNIIFSSLSPISYGELEVTADSMTLDDLLTDVKIGYSSDQVNGLTSLTALWKDSPLSLNFNFKDDGQLPDFYINKKYTEINDALDILKLNLNFSAPIEFSKTWKFNGNSYESSHLAFKNTEPGILTLNDNIPELTNIYIKDMSLDINDDDTLNLTATGTHPLLYGDKPVKISTKLQRNVE